MAHLVLDDEAQDFHQALNLHHSQEARTMSQRLGVSVAISVGLALPVTLYFERAA
jgi:hypothetical protein